MQTLPQTPLIRAQNCYEDEDGKIRISEACLASKFYIDQQKTLNANQYHFVYKQFTKTIALTICPCRDFAALGISQIEANRQH